MISMNCWSPQSDQRGVVLGNGNNTSHGNGNSHLSPPVAVLKRAAAAARYRECQKNHAAALGGNATDGCGEFMPGGERGTIEALKCSACGCHRNFHRKDQADAKYDCHGAALGHHYASETTEERATNAVAVAAGRAGKRFRTKFTAEQKEKMWRFAEKAGWKIQKVEESEVERLCREIGIKRRVLKVWMHNNKHCKPPLGIS